MEKFYISSLNGVSKNISIRLSDLPAPVFILIFTILCKITSIICALLADNIVVRFGIKFIVDNSTWQETFLFGVLLAPIVETAIFQVGVFGILSSIKVLKNRKGWIILLGGLIFGIAHSYNSVYVIAMIPVGVLLMYAYIIRQKKNDAFFVVFLIHLFSNLISLLLKITLNH